jgi:hypothetical protein
MAAAAALDLLQVSQLLAAQEALHPVEILIIPEVRADLVHKLMAVRMEPEAVL